MFSSALTYLGLVTPLWSLSMSTFKSLSDLCLKADRVTDKVVARCKEVSLKPSAFAEKVSIARGYTANALHAAARKIEVKGVQVITSF